MLSTTVASVSSRYLWQYYAMRVLWGYSDVNIADKASQEESGGIYFGLYSAVYSPHDNKCLWHKFMRKREHTWYEIAYQAETTNL